VRSHAFPPPGILPAYPASQSQFHQAMNTASQQLHQLQKQVTKRPATGRGLTAVQQVERDGKQLTKAALTMPQMPLNCHLPTSTGGFRHGLLQVQPSSPFCEFLSVTSSLS
jgi:hypothetical protein